MTGRAAPAAGSQPLAPALLASLALVALAGHLGAYLGGASLEHIWELAYQEGARAAGTAWGESWRPGTGGGPLYHTGLLALRDAGLPARGVQLLQALLHLGMLAAWVRLAPGRLGQSAAMLAGLVLALDLTLATRLMENSALLAFMAPAALVLMPRSAGEAPSRWLAWAGAAALALHLSMAALVLWLPLAVPLLRRDGAGKGRRIGLAGLAAAAAAAGMAHALPTMVGTLGSLAAGEQGTGAASGRLAATLGNLGHPLFLLGAVAALIPGPPRVERLIFGLALAGGWALPALASAPGPLEPAHAATGAAASAALLGMAAAALLGARFPRRTALRAAALLAVGLATAAGLAALTHQPDLPGERECPAAAAAAVLQRAETRGLWAPGTITVVHGVKARCLTGLAHWEAHRRGLEPTGPARHLLASRHLLGPGEAPAVRGVHLVRVAALPLAGGSAPPSPPAGKALYLGVEGRDLPAGMTLTSTAGTVRPLVTCGLGDDDRDCADLGAYLIFAPLPPDAGPLKLRVPGGGPPPRLVEALALEAAAHAR